MSNSTRAFQTLASSLLLLASLSACNAEVGSVTAATPKADIAPGTLFTDPSVTATPTPLPTATPTPEPFCVTADLRSVYMQPFPYFYSELYNKLVYDGVSGRIANPHCLAQYTIYQGGSAFIPCAIMVSATVGSLYGSSWKTGDRTWMRDAIETEANRQHLLASGQVKVTIEDIFAGSKFDSIPGFHGKSAVVIEIQNSAQFVGYCEN